VVVSHVGEKGDWVRQVRGGRLSYRAGLNSQSQTSPLQSSTSSPRGLANVTGHDGIVGDAGWDVQRDVSAAARVSATGDRQRSHRRAWGGCRRGARNCWRPDIGANQ
jgi:hypothetical protein